MSGINIPGHLLIFKKISTQDMLIPDTPFIYFLNFFHPPRLFWMLFFSSRTYNHEEIKNFFNYSYKNLLFCVLINVLFFDYPNHQVRNFTTSFFKTCTCTRCSFVSIVNGFSHLISFKKYLSHTDLHINKQ